MRPSKSTLTLVLAALVTGSVLAVGATANPRDASSRAHVAFVEETGARCVAASDVFIHIPTLEAVIAKSSANAGWVIPGRLFVGDLNAAVASLGAKVLAADDATSWLSSKEGDKPRLLGLTRHDFAGRAAYLVLETYEVC